VQLGNEENAGTLTEVTDEVTAGTYGTATIASAENEFLYMRVKARASARPGLARGFLVTGTSNVDPTKKDVVIARAVVTF
jgi:hypothetical protein